ncbi:MAG: hypothetical protein JNL21_00660 [Myxococcales bacterium]|nr:hypothetical protein [Myxococcales bacterium]
MPYMASLDDFRVDARSVDAAALEDVMAVVSELHADDVAAADIARCAESLALAHPTLVAALECSGEEGETWITIVERGRTYQTTAGEPAFERLRDQLEASPLATSQKPATAELSMATGPGNCFVVPSLEARRSLPHDLTLLARPKPYADALLEAFDAPVNEGLERPIIEYRVALARILVRIDRPDVHARLARALIEETFPVANAIAEAGYHAGLRDRVREALLTAFRSREVDEDVARRLMAALPALEGPAADWAWAAELPELHRRLAPEKESVSDRILAVLPTLSTRTTDHRELVTRCAEVKAARRERILAKAKNPLVEAAREGDADRRALALELLAALGVPATELAPLARGLEQTGPLRDVLREPDPDGSLEVSPAQAVRWVRDSVRHSATAPTAGAPLVTASLAADGLGIIDVVDLRGGEITTWSARIPFGVRQAVPCGRFVVVANLRGSLVVYGDGKRLGPFPDLGDGALPLREVAANDRGLAFVWTDLGLNAVHIESRKRAWLTRALEAPGIADGAARIWVRGDDLYYLAQRRLYRLDPGSGRRKASYPIPFKENQGLRAGPDGELVVLDGTQYLGVLLTSGWCVDAKGRGTGRVEPLFRHAHEVAIDDGTVADVSTGDILFRRPDGTRSRVVVPGIEQVHGVEDGAVIVYRPTPGTWGRGTCTAIDHVPVPR